MKKFFVRVLQVAVLCASFAAAADDLYGTYYGYMQDGSSCSITINPSYNSFAYEATTSIDSLGVRFFLRRGAFGTNPIDPDILQGRTGRPDAYTETLTLYTNGESLQSFTMSYNSDPSAWVCTIE